MGTNDEMKLRGRYNAGYGQISCKMMMELSCEEEWEAYMEIVMFSHCKVVEVVASLCGGKSR